MFPATFLEILIYGALAWTGLGAIVLLTLLLKDHRKRSIW